VLERSEGIEAELSRDLSLFPITMMGVGMMIGAGVFVCTGISIGESGPGGILITFALNGLIALFTGMSYAELSSAIPRAGGGYDYVRESFRGPWGFITGWMAWFASSVAGSLYAITFSLYSLHFLKSFAIFHGLGLENVVIEKIVAGIIAIIFIYINYRGASETGAAGSVMTVGQTITLAIIIIGGVVTVFRQPSRLENFTPFLPQGWGKIIVTMGFTYIAFEGYEVISRTAEEVISPKRYLPKAILYSLLIVVTTYLLVAFSVIVGVEGQRQDAWEWFHQRGATGFSDAVAQMLPFGGMLVIIAVIFSSTSALNATTYSATRVAFALGRDKYLPPILAHISKRTRIPDVALLFSAIIILGTAVALPVEDVASGASIMFLLTFLLINLSVIKVRQDRGDELSYGYIMPFFPYIPIIAIVAQLILAIWLIDMSIIAWIVAGIWIISGFVLYYAYSKGRAIEEEEVIVLREAKELVRKEYQVLVPVANPANAAKLMDYATRIARAKDGEILIMSMAIVPEQTPISEARQFVTASEAAINEALQHASEDIPIHSTVRYGHNPSRGIIGAVREHESDLVILGWRGHSLLHDFTLGSTIDPVIERANCDSIVVKLGSDVQPKKILVPIAGGPHSGFALEIAAIMAESFDAEITAIHVLRRGTTEQEARAILEPILESIGDKTKIASVKFIGPGDVVDLIIAEAQDYDMVIIGATLEGLFRRVVFGSIPERIGKESDKIVMMVKKNLGLRSWVQKWLGS
ncbi:TPA: amino acid permease, partial [Candidatus Poribacteria bacterium]|nr:amino acid permease [Candidatus Poribacteria bacterium]